MYFALVWFGEGGARGAYIVPVVVVRHKGRFLFALVAALADWTALGVSAPPMRVILLVLLLQRGPGELVIYEDARALLLAANVDGEEGAGADGGGQDDGFWVGGVAVGDSIGGDGLDYHLGDLDLHFGFCWWLVGVEGNDFALVGADGDGRDGKFGGLDSGLDDARLLAVAAGVEVALVGADDRDGLVVDGVGVAVSPDAGLLGIVEAELVGELIETIVNGTGRWGVIVLHSISI